MKKLKLALAGIAILMFAGNLFAADPLITDANNLAGIMVDKLSKDIILTDSQKVIIRQNATAFFGKMQKANSSSSDNDKFKLKKQASDEYKVILESILTTEQKETLLKKAKEREDAIVKQYTKQ